MSRVVWIVAGPRVAATGAIATVRLAGGGRDKPYRHPVSGEQHRAGIARLPRFRGSLEFGEDGWTGGTVPQTGRIRFAPAEKALLSALAAFHWPDAAITVELGTEGTVPALLLSGAVASIAVDEAGLDIEIADLSKALDKPIASGRFAGTGGIEGGAEAAERTKRRSWGRVFNVEGRVLDKTANIYEFGDPAFPLLAFTALRDIGRSGPFETLAWAGSVAATLAALKAAVPAEGGGIAAPSIACVKWWTQPVGPLTADISGETGGGYVETVPRIAARIAAAAGGPGIANAAAIEAARPDPAGLHLAEPGETAAAALDRLLLGASLLWVLQPGGAILLREWSFAAPGETIQSRAVKRTRSFQPMKLRRVGYQRSNRIHADSEIASVLLQPALNPRGEWTAGTAYAKGDLVGRDGSMWEVTVPHTASADAPPPNANVRLFVSRGQSTAVVYLYRRAASAPEGPNAATTYTFATKALTGDPGNGWSAAPPAGTNPLYFVAASAVSAGPTDPIAANEWSAPALLGPGGIGGLNSATVFLYRRTAALAPPSLPTTASTYTFATGALTGHDGGWSRTIPTAGGRFLHVTTATAAAAAATDEIGPGEWAEASLLSVDGTSGSNNAVVFLFRRSATQPAGPSGLVDYTFSTKTLSGDPGGGWLFAMPDGTDPLWVIAATASSIGDVDTIASAEWSAAARLGASGTAGLNTASIFLYRRTASAEPPALPSTAATYTFATGALAGHDNGWSRTVPTAGGKHLHVTTATAISAGATDEIAASEWAAARLMASDGQDGTPGDDGLPGAPGLPGGAGWTAIANGIVEGNTLRRATPTNNYDAAAVGPAFQGGAYVSQKNLRDGKWQMLALDDDATTYDYNQQRYLLQVIGQSYYLFVDGVVALQWSDAHLLSSEHLRLQVDGSFVKCFADSHQVFAWPSYLPVGSSLFPKVIAYGRTETITGLDAGPIAATSRLGENLWYGGGGPLIVPVDIVTSESPMLDNIGWDGRVLDPRFYNTQMLLGMTSTTTLTPSYTANGGNWTVNLPAHQRKIAGQSGAIALYYGAGSGVVAASTFWYAYIIDAALAGNASPTIHFTTNGDDLLQPGAYLVSAGLSPAAGTSDPPPPGSGGGGGGGGNRYGEIPEIP